MPEVLGNDGVCDDVPAPLAATRCPLCLSAQVKADLDGRKCGTCDCLCTGWPYNQVAVRRQLRKKYGLRLDIATSTCGCITQSCGNSCRDTYAEDCWCVLACAMACTVICMWMSGNPSYGRTNGWLIFYHFT